MPQARIDAIFKPTAPRTSPSGTNFLSLPKDVRCRIYLEAGVSTDCAINLNYKPEKKKKYLELIDDSKVKYEPDLIDLTNPVEDPVDEPVNGYDLDAMSDDTTYAGCDMLTTRSLLLTSQTVYDDVCAMLYGENKIAVRRTNSRGLRLLQDLTPRAIANLTNLTIRLTPINACYKEHGYGARRVEEGGTVLDCCQPCHEKALGHSTRADKLIISQWRQLIEQLSKHAVPASLKLYLLCEVKNYEAAKRIVAPLAIFTNLKDCGIRLKTALDRPLQSLAEETALRATGVWRREQHSGRPGAAALMTIPRELRLRILSLTDLVPANSRPIEVLPDMRLRPVPRPYENVETFDDWDPDRLDYCTTGNCTDCNDPSGACFCRRYHSAYTARCQCWASPASLFAVCRTLREEARYILDTRNVFVGQSKAS